MLMSIISLVSGFLLLIWSADAFTNNGAKIAKIFNISPLIIGLLIFGFGTSAPEMLVSGLAAYEGHPEMSIGNAFGSNIFNIALVLGITAMILPITVNKKIIRREWCFLITYTLITGLLLLHKQDLSAMDGIILIILLVIFFWDTYKKSKEDKYKFENLSSSVDSSQKGKIWRKLFFALIFLLTSAQAIVFGATKLADYYHVSDLIIGLTFVALGTSLPELAVSISSAIKKQHEMVVGNIIGSNIFNTVAVLAIPSLISPLKVQEEVIKIDYPVMLLLTLLLYLFFLLSPITKLKDTLNRLEGFFLIIILGIYIYYRFLI